jgi:hypothetical protein
MNGHHAVCHARTDWSDERRTGTNAPVDGFPNDWERLARLTCLRNAGWREFRAATARLACAFVACQPKLTRLVAGERRLASPDRFEPRLGPEAIRKKVTARPGNMGVGCHLARLLEVCKMRVFWKTLRVLQAASHVTVGP